MIIIGIDVLMALGHKKPSRSSLAVDIANKAQDETRDRVMGGENRVEVRKSSWDVCTMTDWVD